MLTRAAGAPGCGARRRLLDGATLAAAAGEVVLVAGPCAAAVGALLQVAAGVVVPERGRVRWARGVRPSLAPWDAEGAGVGQPERAVAPGALADRVVLEGRVLATPQEAVAALLARRARDAAGALRAVWLRDGRVVPLLHLGAAPGRSVDPPPGPV